VSHLPHLVTKEAEVVLLFI